MKKFAQNTLRYILAGLCLFSVVAVFDARALVLYWDPNGTTSVGGNGIWETTSNRWAGASTQTTSLLVWPATGILGGTNCAACFSAGPTGSANQGTFVVTVTNVINTAGIFNGQLNPGPCTITLNATGTGALNLLPALCAFDTFNAVTTVNAPITGSGVLNLESSGQTYLNNSNSYTGGTALGNGIGNSFSGLVYYNNSNSFGTGIITMTNTGGGICAVVEATGTNGVVIPNAWKITPTTGGINLAIQDASATASFTGAWTLTSNLNIGTGATAQNNIITLSGVMSGAGALNKFNPNTLRLSGANTYTGATTVSNGTLQLGAAGGIPSGTGKGNVTIASLGTLDLHGVSGSVNGLSGAGTVDNTSGTGTLTVGNNNATSSFTGIIQNTAGTANITKAGTGTFTLGGPNSYSGVTTVNAGSLLLGADNTIPTTSPVVLAAAGTLNMGGHNDTIASLSGPGSITSNTGVLTVGGDFSTNSFNAYSCFFGTIDQGELIKSGSHAMSLRQTNLYNPNVTFNFQGGVLSVGAGPDRLPPSTALSIPFGGIFQLDANNQAVSTVSGSGAINLGGGTFTINATNGGSFYPGVIQNSELPGSSTAGGHGLRGYYYTNNDFTGLAAVRDDATVNFTNFNVPANLPTPPYPKTNFISIRWLGQVLTTVAGNYVFTTTSDDGQRLWVNGTLMVDNWASQGATAKSGTNALAANTRYDVVMEYMNITGGATTKLAWTPPGDTVSTVIPTDFLFLPGPGNLVISGSSQVTLSASNSYTGGTIVNSGGTLDAEADGAFGLGNVSLGSGASLTLENGATNGYIGTSGDLLMTPSSLVLLNFSGTNTIHGFSTNGGAAYLPVGTYGSIGSGATFQLGQLLNGGILNVTAVPSGITLVASTGSSVYGTPVNFTSTISGSGPTPTGTVTLYDGASAIASMSLDGTGKAIFSISDLQVVTSPHSIRAVYSGDAVYIQSTSSTLTQTVTPLVISPGTLVVSNKVYDATVNGSVGTTSTLVGVLAPDTNNVHIGTGTVTFSDKNVGTGKAVTLTNLTIVGGLAGNYSLSPNGGTSTANITALGLAVTNVTANNRIYNGTTNATLNTGSANLATVLGSDSVTLNSGGATGNFASATVGNAKAVTATGFTISGTDATNYALAQPIGITANITQASTTNLVGASLNPVPPGTNVFFTSVPTPIAPGAGTPTGPVIFLTNGVAFITNNLSSGTALTTPTTNLFAGANTIEARYAGDVNFVGSTNTLSEVVGNTSPATNIVLSAVLSGTNVVLSWTTNNSTGLKLQGTPVLAVGSNAWTNVSAPTNVVGSSNSVADPIAGKNFYRLKYP